MRAEIERALWEQRSTPWSFDEIMALARQPGTETLGVLETDASGRPRAAGKLRRSLVDEPASAWVDVWVPEPFRRAGLGTAVHAELVAAARERGVRLLRSRTDVPLDGSGEPVDAGPTVFALRLGYRPVLLTYRNDLSLPPAPEVAERARAEAAAGLGDEYVVETAAGEVPVEWHEGLARLRRRMSTDAPQGVDLDEEEWTAARVAELDAMRRQMGRLFVTSVARHVPTGELVGYSDISDTTADEVSAYQQDTLVLREHRGHRIGLALKLAATEALVAARPSLRVVHTWNAASNAPMLRVNDGLGFARVGHAQEWALDLPEVASNE